MAKIQLKAMDEGWVIKCGTMLSGKDYYWSGTDVFAYTVALENAVRFVREEDAKIVGQFIIRGKTTMAVNLKDLRREEEPVPQEEVSMESIG